MLLTRLISLLLRSLALAGLISLTLLLAGLITLVLLLALLSLLLRSLALAGLITLALLLATLLALLRFVTFTVLFHWFPPYEFDWFLIRIRRRQPEMYHESRRSLILCDSGSTLPVPSEFCLMKVIA